MKRFIFIIIFGLPGLSPFILRGQYCTPTANCSDDDFINNFSFNTISNLNSAGSNCFTNSYVNTGLSTSVTKGSAYNLTVQSGPTWPEGFGVWIDYNKDNDFNDAGEFVYSSPSASTNSFMGTVTIPTSALNGTTRMRVRCKYGATVAANESCSSFTYGETEDYSVVIQPNNIPPAANFTANGTMSCSGVVSFTDLSTNNPASWLWNFGDTTTSTTQNPTHTYSYNGTFTVTLIVANAFGSDTLVKVNYITVNSAGGVIAASCTPYTRSAFSGFGITNVVFNNINNTSSDCTAGYQDFTCQSGTNVLAGQSYTISITAAAPSNQNFRTWIDFNNDGVFTEPDELGFSQDNATSASGAVYLPPTAIVNTPLRMRVSANYYLSSVLTPCDSIDYGQAEDYSITILENANPPVADFGTDKIITCNGTIQFYDQSQNIPIAWSWDFGDSATSTQQNPVHTYAASGTYTITFIALNLYGSDTVIMTNYITVNLNGAPQPASCTPNTLGYCCGYGIYNVTLSALTNPTSDGKEGYMDFSCELQVTVTQGNGYAVSIQTSAANPQDTRIWIDFNNDGFLDNVSELVFAANNAINPSGTIFISGSAVLNTPLRLRIFSDAVGSTITPCTNPLNGQAEDYSVVVVANTFPPDAYFTAADVSICGPTATFTDTSVNIPTSWLWYFGDGATDTTQNPSHTYSATGTYSVKLVCCNAYGCDSISKINYIQIISLTGGPVDASCIPNTASYCCNIGIYNVTLYTINNTTADGVEGYRDYSCSITTTLVEGQMYSMSVQTGPDYEENVRAWIDYNNNGSFQPGELVFSSDNILTYHSGNFTVPSSAATNIPLRLRVASDYAFGPPPDGCSDVTYGQAEDYSVTIISNTSPPFAGFIAGSASTCNGIVQFTDQSVNGTSWLWNFGDGNTSTNQNPLHTYYSLGIYSVTLIACNGYGCDTLVKTNYINFIDPPLAPSCTPTTTSWCCGRGILNVSLGMINNTTNDGSDGYKDYTCQASTYLNAGQSYSLSVQTGNTDPEDVRVWIDYNNSSAFTAGEIVMTALNITGIHTGTITVPATATKNMTLRMRVASDYAPQPTPTSCANVTYGQFEDYSVIIVNPLPPVASFIVDLSQQCTGTVQFTDQSQNFPASWYWDFGDGGTSTTVNPYYTYSQPGTYTVTLIASNSNGSDTSQQQVTLDFPIALFSMSADSAGAGDTIFFTNNSTGADGWQWDFGDGVQSSQQNPNHYYSSPGIYTVTLYVINSLTGCSAQTTLQVNIETIVKAVTPPPLESITVFPVPAGNFIQIESLTSPIERVIVTGLQGQEIYSTDGNQNKTIRLVTSNFSKGVYFILVFTSGNIVQRRIFLKE